MTGVGVSALYALFAAVINREVDELHLENMIGSFEEMARTRLFVYDVRYGVLKRLDIPLMNKALQNDITVTSANNPYVGEFMKRRFY